MTRDEIERRADFILAAWPDAETMHTRIAAALVEMHDAGIETAIKATGMGGLGRIAARAKTLGGQR